MTQQTQHLTNSRVALVTGGSRGIGLGICRALADEGWSLAVGGTRDESDVADVLEDLCDCGVEVAYCRGDVAEAADRHQILDTVRERFGRLNLLVNNAGITSQGRRDLLEADEAGFDRVFAVNLKGPYFLTQAAARWMIDQKRASADFRGAIVNISSVSAEVVSTNRGDYCLTKAAIGMATKLWAARLAEFDIPVYEIRPGVIRTDMTAGVVEKYDRLIAEGLTLQRRWGTPEDVGRAAALLARGDLPYATGQVLRIDGGLSIRTM
ncbi:MAG: 3-ketoacyl-ACP reductase [Planctomycetes bacterium]|nr:3-ketoacyl-ACP reductase [Planctomycetota bacterium]